MSQHPDLQLSLDFPKIFIAGIGSHFKACVVNSSDQRLEGVAISFVCQGFDPPEITLEFEDVPPGEHRERPVAVHPVRIGSQLMSCSLECVQGGLQRRFSGTWQGLTVFEKPASQISITNIVQDIQSHRGQDKAGYGAINGDVSINMTSHLGDVRSLNDLLAITLPPAWHPLPLSSLTAMDYRRTTNRRRIPATFQRVYEPMQALSLRPMEAPQESSATDPTVCGWHLKGGAASQLVLGRSSTDCDLVTRFMPQDEANHGKSAGLSRKHARLSVAESGLLQVTNISSGNVVLAGRSAVAVGAGSPLSGNEILALGIPPADLRLNILLAPAPEHDIKPVNIEEWQGYNASRILPAPTFSWGHAQIQWLNSAPSFWTTVWFGQMAAFGSAPEAPISLGDSGLDPCHGFIHHLHGCYWLEVISDRDGVWLEDPQNAAFTGPQPVPPGVLLPLRSYMQLTLGSKVLRLRKAA